MNMRNDAVCYTMLCYKLSYHTIEN
jgi:hypothetical protein